MTKAELVRYLRLNVNIQNANVTDTAYLSMKDVLPVYYGNVVEQKGLRNQDSIEMLDIILGSKSIDLGILFGWSNALLESMRDKFFAGTIDIASLIQKQQASIEKKMDKTVEAIQAAIENS